MKESPVEWIKVKYTPPPGRHPKSQKCKLRTNGKPPSGFIPKGAAGKKGVKGDRVLLMIDAYRGKTVLVTSSEATRRLEEKRDV